MYSQQVDELLRYLGIHIHTKYPFSPIILSDIVARFGIKLKLVELNDLTSGVFVKCNKGNYIFINNRHHMHRQRFSAGHEFGHYMLGHPSDLSSLLITDAQRQIEREANRYSGCLLMPPDLMFALHKEKRTIPEMAEWLRVSTICASIRLLRLELRKEEADQIINEYRRHQDDPEFATDGIPVLS